MSNKANSKRSIIIGLVLIFAVIAAFIITILLCNLKSCGGDDGTYYRLKGNGELDKATYFILKSGKWEDEDGESGTYKIDGENITFYFEFFGEKEELCDGTLKDGILKVNGDTFAIEKAKENSTKKSQSELFAITGTTVLVFEKFN